MRKTIAILLALAMVLSLSGLGAWAAKAGDVMIVDNESPDYKENGKFDTSGLVGDNGVKTRFCNAADASAVYQPALENSTYKISVYKVKHETSVVQTYTIHHQDKMDKVDVDFTQGESGYVELGTFDFWGHPTESVVVTGTNITGTMPLRTAAVKFELVKLSDQPAPSAAPTPTPTLDPMQQVLDIPVLEQNTDEISVLIDYQRQTYDQPPVLVSDRTMVPMRGIFEALDASVSWNDETQTVTAVKGEVAVNLTIGQKTAYQNGSPVELDVEPMLLNDRTLVPLRFVGETLGCTVNWKEEDNQVEILTGKELAKTFYLDFTQFEDMGTWTTDGYTGALNGTNMRGKTDSEGEALPAVANLYVQQEADYRVYVRTRGFTTDPEARFFNVSVNDVALNKTFGQHGVAKWEWEEGGIIHMKPGQVQVKLLDTSQFYARVDSILITCDPAVKELPDTMEKLSALIDMKPDYDPNVNYPAWAKTGAQPAETVEISNSDVKINFHTVQTDAGAVVQKETFLNTEGGFAMTSGRENGLGALLMYAKEGKNNGEGSQYPFFEVTYERKGSLKKSITSDLYKAGKPYWLIPSKVEKTADNQAVLTATSDVADARFVWELKEGEQEATVTFTLTPKVKGNFSASMNAAVEQSVDKANFILSPLRDVGRKLPEDGRIISEKYASVPMSMVNVDNPDGKAVNLGVVIEPSMIQDWVYTENDRYGFGIRGPQGGVIPSLVAPLPGREDGAMDAGGSYTITYKALENFGDWYAGFSHAVKDIIGLTDYRENYYGGLTDTVFNTTKLALDPKYSGWDVNMKAHYNIEGQYSSSQANPVVYLSSYLFTEDETMLDTRTIPTLAFLLTRDRLHFTNSTVKGTGNPGLVFDEPLPVGTPTKAFGTSVMGGIYQMSRGYNDKFEELGYENGPVYYNAYGSIPKFSEQAWAYRYTGKQEYLDAAKQGADEFIEKNITNPSTQHPSYDQFIAISFYPNFQALIDLYEICGEQKYLDAAVEGARMMLATVWVSPTPADDDMVTISADAIRENHFAKGESGANFYYDKVWRIGYPEGLEALEDETVPHWLVSRTGLSIEQTSTFNQHHSGNMIMTNWAADLMRLFAYTGDELFETYARNAVIGRYTNYPGYYYNQYQTVQMKPDYPYTGPDITGIYQHHIPPFLSMVQDFLITQAFGWSDQKIHFPSIRQQGYAYFSSREFGIDAGKVYDQDGMWLWLKDGLLDTDNLQVDWFGARKDGKAAFVLMNESADPQTAQLQLGAEVAGGSFSGNVTVYDRDGNQTQAVMDNGKLAVDMAGHDLKTVLIEDASIQAPAYAAADAEGETGVTCVEPAAGDFGTGYLLQVTPSVYHAYVYSTSNPKQAAKEVLHYKVGDGAWQQVEQNVYPFEFIVKVEEPEKSFTFYLEETDLSGNVKKSQEKTLIPKK